MTVRGALRAEPNTAAPAPMGAQAGSSSESDEFALPTRAAGPWKRDRQPAAVSVKKEKVATPPRESKPVVAAPPATVLDAPAPKTAPPLPDDAAAPPRPGAIGTPPRADEVVRQGTAILSPPPSRPAELEVRPTLPRVRPLLPRSANSKPHSASAAPTAPPIRSVPRDVQPVAWQEPAGDEQPESPPGKRPVPPPPLPRAPRPAPPPAPQRTVDTEVAPLPEPVPPEPKPQVRIPLVGPANPDRIQLTPLEDGKITLIVRDAPLNEVLGALAIQEGVNIVAADDVTGKISVTLRDVSFEDALTSLTAVGGFTWNHQNNIIHVTSLASNHKTAPVAQGRIVQVFNLNFVAATDVETVAKGLLSPVGQIFITKASPTDNRKTHDSVVVEDLPYYVARVADYIGQIDHPPRQVLIEAHVLQVELTDQLRHGINWGAVGNLGKIKLTANTLGLATPTANPATVLALTATDLNSVIEFLENTTDSKTLAQPRVLVLNGQQSRIQIGKRFGYLVTTTTQTSTLQNVNFLEVGVLLTVKPQISDDHHILLTVKPEVSDGSINPANNLPQQDTTEVETNVLLADGQGIVIGGLIKEQNVDKQSKVPVLGDMWLLGRLFQMRNTTRQRVEIVVALIPRIVPYCSDDFVKRDMVDYQRATTPLLVGPLKPAYRPWEPKLPDSIENARKWKCGRTEDFFTSPWNQKPYVSDHYFPAPSDEAPWLHSPDSYRYGNHASDPTGPPGPPAVPPAPSDPQRSSAPPFPDQRPQTEEAPPPLPE